MKRVIPVLLLSVFLVGCAAPAQTQLPIVTVTSTSTHLPTPTPTVTPTATETPTPTKDPNAPPEYSRFENGVYYLDEQTENGNTLTYTWNTERGIYERLYFTAPLWDNPNEYDFFNIFVYVDRGLDGESQLPTLTHKPNNDPPESRNFTEFFMDRLMSTMADHGIVPNRNNIDLNPMYDGSHAFHFDFYNADGPQSWGIWGSNGADLSDGTTVTVHVRGDYEQLKANSDTNGFSAARSSNLYGPVGEYMVKVSSNNGNLIVDIAPSIPVSQLTKKNFMEIIMSGPANVMEKSPDLTHPGSGGELSLYVLNQENYSLFEMGPPP